MVVGYSTFADVADLLVDFVSRCKPNCVLTADGFLCVSNNLNDCQQAVLAITRGLRLT